jgi:hypothetical protein
MPRLAERIVVASRCDLIEESLGVAVEIAEPVSLQATGEAR